MMGVSTIQVAPRPGAGAVRPTSPDEREQIVQVAIEASVFTAREVATVAEMLGAYYDDPEASGYHFLSYREGGRVLGFACWGPRDLAMHAFDLYWIAARPDAQRRGIGRLLMEAVEAQAGARGGGWMWVETSDTPTYVGARALYERRGYRRLALLPNFYRSGDGLAIYVKWIESSGRVVARSGRAKRSNGRAKRSGGRAKRSREAVARSGRAKRSREAVARSGRVARSLGPGGRR